MEISASGTFLNVSDPTDGKEAAYHCEILRNVVLVFDVKVFIWT